MKVCVNCESEDVVEFVTIRGTALVKGGLVVDIIDKEVTSVLHSECNDCGHRW